MFQTKCSTILVENQEWERIMDKKDFIGIFDSGIGGISVLKHAVTELENEDFI